MKYLKLFEDGSSQTPNTAKNLARLRQLGIAKYSATWEVQLEIDWDQAAQSEPQEIKDYFIEIFVDQAEQYEYRIDVDSIEVDKWKHSNYWRGINPNYNRRDFVTFTLESPTADQEEVEQWIDDHLLGRLFSSLESIEKNEYNEEAEEASDQII